MRDVLKLALEALELVSIEFVCNGAHHAKKDRHDWLESCPVVERYQAAITAVKEALAPTSTQCEVQYEQSFSQEPVAWCQLFLGGRSIAYFDGKPIIMTGKVGNDCHTTPLYTTPPKRPWVGLTDEDLEFWTKELGQEELGRGVLRAVADHLKKENT